MSIIFTILTITIILGTGGMANLMTSLSAQGQVRGMKFTAQLSGKDESLFVLRRKFTEVRQSHLVTNEAEKTLKSITPNRR